MNSGDDAGDDLEATRRRAIEALAGRDLLVGELEATLARAGHEPAAAHRVLEELTSQGLLDDDRIHRQRIKRWREAGRSDTDIEHRLTQAGLEPPSIERLLRDSTSASPGDPETPSSFDAAVEAVRRRGRGLDPTSREDLRRLAARLARAGFDPDTIRRALRHCDLDDTLLDDD